VKRFLKTSALLFASLFVVASGFDAALDRMSHCATQNSFTVYNDKGAVVLAYQGDLAACKAISKPAPAVSIPAVFHRT
jgi:hypothetical protein